MLIYQIANAILVVSLGQCSWIPWKNITLKIYPHTPWKFRLLNPPPLPLSWSQSLEIPKGVGVQKPKFPRGMGVYFKSNIFPGDPRTLSKGNYQIANAILVVSLGQCSWIPWKNITLKIYPHTPWKFRLLNPHPLWNFQ